MDINILQTLFTAVNWVLLLGSWVAIIAIVVYLVRQAKKNRNR